MSDMREIQQALDEVPAPALITDSDGTQVFKATNDPRDVQLYTVPHLTNAFALIPSLQLPLTWITEDEQ